MFCGRIDALLGAGVRSMIDVRIEIPSKDSKVGAMVKALSFEVSGPSSVKGATTEFLRQHGHLVFRFPDEERALEFRQSIAQYFPGLVARALS